MVTTYPDDEPLRFEQHNHGSGTFIGRDNYGTINAIDETTQAILKRLSKEAPALAQLLRKALHDGVISPDVAYALEVAARNINEDVAYALWIAGRNINEDVAYDLRVAGEKISDTAELSRIVTRIEESLEHFERISSTLNAMTHPYRQDSLANQLNRIIDNIKYQADRIDSTATPPPAQIVVNWKATIYAFVLGVIAGMALLAYSMPR